MSGALSLLAGYGSGSSDDASDSEPTSTYVAPSASPLIGDSTLHLRQHDKASSSTSTLDFAIVSAQHVQPNASMDPRRHLDPNKNDGNYNPKYEELYASSSSTYTSSLEFAVVSAPHVQPNASMDPRRHLDPNKNEVKYTPKYDELYAPLFGHANPNKTQQQAVNKNILSGSVEDAHVEDVHVNEFQLETQRRTFPSYGCAYDPSVGDRSGGDTMGMKREAFTEIEFGGSERLPKMMKIEKMGYVGSQMNSSGRSAKFSVNEEGFTEVYTDGACLNNGSDSAKAGVGVWFGHGHKLNVARPVLRSKQTNNSAEIQAASVAIQLAVDNGVNKLIIHTDSQFLINCVTMWMSNWKKNGWMTRSKNPVKNREDLEELDKAMNSGNIQVKWNHVKGHAGIEGNEEADKLAVKGAHMSR